MSEEIYTCPMHPEVQENSSGRCSICGMALIPSPHPLPLKGERDKGRGGHDKHAGHGLGMFKRKFWISLALTIPVVVARFIELPGGIYLSAILGSVVFFYGGWVFIAGAWREIRGRLPGMMTLIGVAVWAAYLWSLYAVLAGEEPLFWELTTLITIMLLGHWLEMRAVSGAQSALKELSKLLPDTAERIIQNAKIKTQNDNSKSKIEQVPVSELRVADLILVRPGGKIAADGEIVEGESEVNEAMVTGESKPVSKKPEDKVIAGTINGDGSLQVKVTHIGEKTFLAGVMRLVAEAQASKSRLQILSDRAALYLTIIAVAGGVITLIAWLMTGAEVAFAVARLVAVLVIACPHALGLAVPLVASISTTMAASRGFLVKQRLALEQARKIDVILFDKTGTLTKGEHEVTKVQSSSVAAGKVQNEILRLAAALESHSEHIVGKAIVKKAQEENLTVPEVKDFKALPGRGVQGVVEERQVMAGNQRILPSHLSSPTRREELKEGAEAQTIVYVVVDEELVGQITLVDVIREESRQAVLNLQGLGIRVAMVTGDSEAVARSVAEELGIEEYRAQVLPEDKVRVVKEFQSQGRVAFVGDGINDAPALAQADLGIAIGAGTNVAIESAGIILVKNNPGDVVKIIKLSQLTYTKMLQNLFWATGYNVIALPLAAGVLASQGVILEPAVGALFMSLSTVIVAVNALLLRKKEL